LKRREEQDPLENHHPLVGGVLNMIKKGGGVLSISDSVFSKDALLSHKRERKRTGIPLNPCLVGRGVMPTAR